jgi:hypothetical protein
MTNLDKDNMNEEEKMVFDIISVDREDVQNSLDLEIAIEDSSGV